MGLYGLASIVEKSRQKLQNRVTNVELEVREKDKHGMGSPFRGKNGIGMLETQFSTVCRKIFGVAKRGEGFECSFTDLCVDLGIIVDDMQQARKSLFTDLSLAVTGKTLE